MSDTSDTLVRKAQGARVTVRLAESELARLRALAESRDEDLTAILRAAIAAYLEREQQDAAHRAEHARLAAELAAGMRREAERVIARHEEITRALIDALNTHLAQTP